MPATLSCSPDTTSKSVAPVSSAGGARFLLIDALRGIAALGVVLHHIIQYAPWQEFGGATLDTTLFTISTLGKSGVPVFFVISGFVIAYSLRHARITPAYVANFAWRRSLRLDPPYWATIAVVVLIDLACIHWWGFEPPCPYPTVPQFFAHLVYLQNVLGLGNISAGFWTLCLEFQFYLIFAAMLGAAQWLTVQLVPRSGTEQSGGERINADQPSPVALLLVFAPVVLSSIFYFSHYEAFDDWFLRYYCLFCLGATLWWSLSGVIPAGVAWTLASLFALRVGIEYNRTLCAGLLASVTVLHVGRLGLLSTFGNWGPLQFLGRTSYSLYLIHFPIAHVLMQFGHRLTGDSNASAFFWMTLSLLASIAAAAVFHRLIEAPTIAFAASFKPTKKSASPSIGITSDAIPFRESPMNSETRNAATVPLTEAAAANEDPAIELANTANEPILAS